MEAFERGAAYYEVFANSVKRLEREGPFLLDRFRRAPGNRVLDLACGTGPHALFFAEHGGMVTAVDAGEGMIAFAQRARPHPNIEYRVGDMRRVEGGPWDFALCLGNSLSLIDSGEGLRDVFKSLSATLTPGAIFVIQVLNHAAEAARVPRHRIEHGRLEDAEIVAVKNLVPHGEHTLLSLNYFVFQGETIDAVSETAVLRHWTQGELTDTAAAHGFVMAECFGGFDGRAWEMEQAPDLVIVFKKTIA